MAETLQLQFFSSLDSSIHGVFFLCFKLLICVERDTCVPLVFLAERPLDCILTLTSRLPVVTPSGGNEAQQPFLASQKQLTPSPGVFSLPAVFPAFLVSKLLQPQRVATFCASKSFAILLKDLY